MSEALRNLLLRAGINPSDSLFDSAEGTDRIYFSTLFEGGLTDRFDTLTQGTGAAVTVSGQGLTLERGSDATGGASAYLSIGNSGSEDLASCKVAFTTRIASFGVTQPNAKAYAGVGYMADASGAFPEELGAGFKATSAGIQGFYNAGGVEVLTAAVPAVDLDREYTMKITPSGAKFYINRVLIGTLNGSIELGGLDFMFAVFGTASGGVLRVYSATISYEDL